MKALLVDDSQTTRMLIGKIIKGLGFETVDWNMPVMNGLECLKELRGNSAWADIKVVMVTTETEIQQVVKAIDCGANEYIMKPFTSEMFAEKLQIIGLDPSK
jgi:two-component system chemotaxis response regulator CheY